jgi:prohibitin 2
MFFVHLLLAVVAIAALVFFFTDYKENQSSPVPIGMVLVAWFVFDGLVRSFGIVAAGNVGVVTRFGGVEEGRILHEGLYMVVPIVEDVHQVDTKPHLIALDDTPAVTRDRQLVRTSVRCLVQVDPAVADQTYRFYRDTIVDQLVQPKFQEAVKTVTARYDARTQVQNRGLVQSDMLSYVQHEVDHKGVLIGPGALSVTNFQYDPEYQKAIEDTQVSQQNRIKAQNDLAVATIEAQQKVATARGEADSQALLARTLTPKSLQFEFYKHWDGKLPSVMGSGTNILDIGQLGGK